MNKRAIQRLKKCSLITLFLFFVTSWLGKGAPEHHNEKALCSFEKPSYSVKNSPHQTPASTGTTDISEPVPANPPHFFLSQTREATSKVAKRNSDSDASFRSDIITAAQKKKNDTLQQLRQKNQTLKEQVKRLSNRCRRLSQENVRQSEEIAEITTKLQKKRSQLENKKSEDSEETKRVQELRSNLKDIRQNYRRSTEQLARLKKNLKRLRILQKNWLSTTQQNSEWHSVLLKLAKRNDLPEAVHQQIKQALSENSRSAQQSENKPNITQKIVTLSGYSTDLPKVKTLSRPVHEVSRQKLVTYVEHLREVKNRLADRLQAIKPALKNLKKLAFSIERKRKLIHQLRKRIRELTSTKNRQRQNLRTLRKQITNLRNENENLRTILENVEQEKSNYTKRYNQLQKSTVNQEQRIMKLKEKRQSLSRDLRKAHRERTRLKKRLENLKDMIKRQEKLLQKSTDTTPSDTSQKTPDEYMESVTTGQQKNTEKAKGKSALLYENLRRQLKKLQNRKNVLKILEKLKRHFTESKPREQTAE